jgi:photosystem II stability/assembly factor-like uncharacterized protein
MRIPVFLFALLFTLTSWAQNNEEPVQLEDVSLSGLKFRSVGPAITSGRIADFAVNPEQPKKYYVAVASGGVWKTENGGVTFTPLFDSQPVYSTGVVTLSPHNYDEVWVGTGENNGQRSVAYGDGVYKSMDGGKSWKNMGLKESNHIGSIIVDPEDPNRVYVAAMGPLWSEGGERGVYISDDGGESWRNTLEIDEHTGVSQIVQHPDNPNVLFAAAYQRRRHVFTYFGGGPGSALYKSTDRGETWVKSQRGFPGGDLGRIGLAISPANPDITYAIVEAAGDKGGFYKSTDMGASWQRQSGYSTSGLYYQEIIADPVDPDRVYSMNTYMQYTDDGGKTFQAVGEGYKHVDNHALWIDPEDPEHLLAGCDGGIYESYDRASTWHYKPNLPVTQFYKVALDNDEPFYNIYGGTQDNFSMGGPSRTISENGIANHEWYMTHGGDGFESQVDPKNPDIVYAQSQYGGLVRYDRSSGEELGIKPMAREGENAYRWNWDAPLHVSVHEDGRIYFAANKLFRSDDRGDSWEVISDDLTRQINRNELPVMGRIWGMDAVAKHQSTSPYGTIVAFHESPLNEEILIVGTDDGLIQITTDGGDTWREVDNIPGVPERTYVNFVLASQHDPSTMYAAFNHHKYGDFKPYVYKSTDMGNTWEAIQGNLPEKGSAYSLAEDHESEDLLFVGTEFGVFFTAEGGNTWKQLKGGLPTIAVRDMAIHPREDDLVLATFGRGFYVLDDYSSLRTLPDVLDEPGTIMTIRDPWLYLEKQPLGRSGNAFQGHSYYRGDNLGPVAMINYYVKESPMTREAERKKADSQARKDEEAGVIPTYEELRAERNERAPYLLFTITDDEGNIVRKLKQSPRAGLQRMEWDMRYASVDPVRPGRNRSGNLVAPGDYSVTMELYHRDEFIPMGYATSFTVKALDNTVLPAPDRDAKTAFQREVAMMNQEVSRVNNRLGELADQLRHIEAAILQTEKDQKGLFRAYQAVADTLTSIREDLNGDPVARALEIDQEPTVSSRIRTINYQQSNTTSAPTKTHRDNLAIVRRQFAPIKQRVMDLLDEQWPALMERLQEAGAPYVPYTLKY